MKIRLSDIAKIKAGSIVAAPCREYIDFPGGAWADHFATIERLYLVRTFPRNNGGFIGEDSQRHIKHININEITRVVNRRRS